MRKILFTFIVLLMAVTSCMERTETTIHRLLKQAEGMMRSAPDTALYLLRYLKKSPVSTETDSMYLKLLIWEAEAKNDIKLQDTLAIRSLTSYYTNQADTAMLARTYRLLALAYRNLGYYHETVTLYNTAITLAKIMDNKRLLGDTYHELANVYYFEGLRTRTEPPRTLADSLFYLTEQTAEELKDTALWINSLLSHSVIPDGRKHYAEWERQLLQASHLSQETNDIGHDAVIAMELSILYGELGEKEKSISFVRKNLDLRKGLIPDYTYYLVWSNAYQRIGEKDSADYYLTKSKQLKEREKMAELSAPSNHLTKEFQKEIIPLEELFERMRISDEYSKELSQRQMTLIISVSILVTFGIISILYLRKHHLRKEARQYKEANAEKQQLIQAHKQTKEQLKQKHEELKQKNDELLLMQREIEALSSNTGSAFDKIKQIVEGYQHKGISKLRMEEADWQQLQLEMNKRWNNAISRIEKEYHLTRNETHLLCLNLLEVPTSHIPYFYQRTVNTIYTWNRQLCAKLGISRNNNTTFKNEFKKFIGNRG